MVGMQKQMVSKQELRKSKLPPKSKVNLRNDLAKYHTQAVNSQKNLISKKLALASFAEKPLNPDNL